MPSTPLDDKIQSGDVVLFKDSLHEQRRTGRSPGASYIVLRFEVAINDRIAFVRTLNGLTPQGPEYGGLG